MLGSKWSARRVRIEICPQWRRQYGDRCVINVDYFGCYISVKTNDIYFIFLNTVTFNCYSNMESLVPTGHWSHA